MKSRWNEKTKVESGALLLELNMPWTGKIATIFLTLSGIPANPGRYSISRNDKDLDPDGMTEIWSEDLAAESLDDVTFAVPVALMAGDLVSVAYPNPDNLTCSCEIIVEAS